MNFGKIAAAAVTIASVLLVACGSDDRAVNAPSTVAPVGLHITGVDDAGAAVNIWAHPFRAATTVTLSASDNEAVTAVRAQAADGELEAFLGGGGGATYSFLTIDGLGGTSRGLVCLGRCSLAINFDAASRKMQVSFPDVYSFYRNISDATYPSSGYVRVAGSLKLDYDPDWLVLHPKRFPETHVSGTILVDGQSFEVERLAAYGLQDGGVYFVAANGSAISLNLIADGATLQLMYQDTVASRTWRAEIPASVMEHVDGSYLIRLDEQRLDNLSADGPDQVVMSLDVTVPEADGTISVMGIAGTDVLYPKSYTLSTTNNVRQYAFAMVNQDGTRFWLTVTEQAGDIQLVQLESETALVNACGVSPWPACAGIRLSDDGYTFSFMAAGLGDGMQLDGNVRHAGVRIWAGGCKAVASAC